MSIVFLAGGEKSSILEALLNNKENVIAVLLPYSKIREERYISLKEICKTNNIPIFRPVKTELKVALSKLSADLLVSAGYPHILSTELLNICRQNINIHPTLLPKFRGPATAWNVIANGEIESGITVHFIDEGMDTGDIIYQEKIELTSFDTIYSLMRKTNDLEPQALIEALKRLRNPFFIAQKQDESISSTFIGLRKPEDSMIDDFKSIKELYNFIRACDPERFPAYFIKDGQKVGIKLFRIDKPKNEIDSI